MHNFFHFGFGQQQQDDGRVGLVDKRWETRHNFFHFGFGQVRVAVGSGWGTKDGRGDEAELFPFQFRSVNIDHQPHPSSKGFSF
jgi:hypothetical protein